METELIKVTEKDTDTLARAAAILRHGGLVVFPTETVYGLGGDATDADAARKIYAAKGRPSDNPLIIHIADPRDAEKYAYTNDLYYKLADAFMPGPITVILKRKPIIPLSVTGGLETVAVRCPSHPVAHALIEATGVPIAAPSANLSGKPSPTCARHVADDMMGRVDMILDGGSSEIGLESTIVKADDGNAALLRPGGITFDMLRSVCPDVTVARAVKEQIGKDEHPLSPGMKYKHYAPATPVVLLSGEEQKILAFLRAEQAKKKCVILCYDEEVPQLTDTGLLLPIGSSAHPETEAHRLFYLLRDADRFHADVIYAHLPEEDGIGLALYNRLIRASAHTIKKID